MSKKNLHHPKKIRVTSYKLIYLFSLNEINKKLIKIKKKISKRRIPKRIRSQPPDLLSRSPDPLCLETARSPRRCSTVSNRLRHHLFLSPSRAHPHRLCHHNLFLSPSQAHRSSKNDQLMLVRKKLRLRTNRSNESSLQIGNWSLPPLSWIERSKALLNFELFVELVPALWISSFVASNF